MCYLTLRNSIILDTDLHNLAVNVQSYKKGVYYFPYTLDVVSYRQLITRVSALKVDPTIVLQQKKEISTKKPYLSHQESQGLSGIK